jgi:serralysin
LSAEATTTTCFRDGDGSDLIVGGDDHDVVVLVGDSGGPNSGDFVFTFSGNDRVDASGATGFKSVDAGAGNDTLTGGPDAEVLFGGDGDDRLFGNGGPDDLRGSDGDDRLFGNEGPDRLECGNGLDLADGGAGTDSAEDDCETVLNVP